MNTTRIATNLGQASSPFQHFPMASNAVANAGQALGTFLLMAMAIWFLSPAAKADTTIASGSTVTVTNPNTYFGAAGIITIAGGGDAPDHANLSG